LPRYAHPNNDELKTIISATEKLYQPMHANMHEADDMYNQKFARVMAGIELPAGISVHRSSTPTQMVNESRDQIPTHEPLVSIMPRGPSRTAERAAEKLQMWGQGIFKATAEQGLVDPYEQVKSHLFLYGAGALKRLVNAEALYELTQRDNESDDDFSARSKDYKSHQENQCPFTVRAVSPLNLMPSPGFGPLRYMIEHQKRRVMDMWHDYPDWKDPKAERLTETERTDPLREVDWIEYWSWVWDHDRDQWTGAYIVQVDGDRVIDIFNPYRQVPYEFGYSGLGFMNMDEAAAPEKLAVGVLHYNMGELADEVILKTAMMSQWQYHVYPRLITTGDPASVRRQFMKGPGAVIKKSLDNNATVEWLKQPEPSITMLQFMDKIDSNLARRVNPALTGERTADYGIHQALQIGQAVKNITPVRTTMNRLAAGTLSGVAKLMRHFGMSMNVHGTKGTVEAPRKVSPNDFRQFIVEVSYETVDPAENDRQMLSALSVKREDDGKLISRGTYRQKWLKGAIVSSEEEEENVMVEKILDQLLESGWLMQLVMQRLKQTTEDENIEGVTAEARQQVSGVAEGAAGGMMEQLSGAGGAVPPGAVPGMPQPPPMEGGPPGAGPPVPGVGGGMPGGIMEALAGQGAMAGPAETQQAGMENVGA
jgi:hypothetical protein